MGHPPHLRKTVAVYISEAAGPEDASRRLGHSSTQITKHFSIAEPPVAADLSELLQALGDASGQAHEERP